MKKILILVLISLGFMSCSQLDIPDYDDYDYTPTTTENSNSEPYIVRTTYFLKTTYISYDTKPKGNTGSKYVREVTNYVYEYTDYYSDGTQETYFRTTKSYGPWY